MDFTPKHDWTTAGPIVEAGRRMDPPKTWEALAAETGISKKTLYSKFGPKTRKGKALTQGQPQGQPRPKAAPAQSPSQTATQGSEGQGQEGGAFSPSPLESARTHARKLLSDAVSGLADPSAQQIAAARLLLKDELEPAGEGASPYAGIPDDELGLRALTLAVSVLGLVRVTAILREEGKRQTLDLGLDWAPAAGDASGQAETLEGGAAQDVAPDGQAVPAVAEGPTASPPGQGLGEPQAAERTNGAGEGGQS
jgi:hypothetical protein